MNSAKSRGRHLNASSLLSLDLQAKYENQIPVVLALIALQVAVTEI